MLTYRAASRMAALLLGLVWIACPVRAWEAEELPRFPLESYRLANGLKVALSQDPAAPRTTVCVAYHVGSKNERPGLTGFAHFFEHMMFRGTENVPNFDTPLQEAGGSPNAFTSEDVTVYFETIPNHYVHRALYMEAERMAFLASALDQEKFDTEREVVKNERRQTMENVPYGLVDETLSSLVYPAGHPYSWSVIGSMRDLNRATLDDLRDFFHEFYHPANATLTVLGGFDLDETKAWIDLYFGVIAAGEPPTPVTAPAVVPQAARVIHKDRVQFPQVHWAWPAVAQTHPDAPALDLLAMILADGDASRLQQSLVVQSQVAVDTSARCEANELGGMFRIWATIAPGSTVEDVERRLEAELTRIRSTAPGDDELARSKRKYRTDLLVGLSSPMRRTIVVALGLAQHDDPEYYRNEFARYEQVTPSDLQRVARKYLVADKTVLIVDPVREGETESEAVEAGPLNGTPRPPLSERAPAAGPDWTQMPAPTAAHPFETPAVSRHRLSNGLSVWVAPWNTLPLVSARLIVQAGSADDPAGQAGLAMLASELWDQGTERLTSTQLAEAVDALGTSLQVNAGSDTTQLSFTAERSVLPEMLEIVGELMTRPRFDPADFDREQQLLLSALTSGPDNPSWIAQRVFPRLLYGPDHPFANPSQGFVDQVQSLALDNVRQFFRAQFTPDNCVLVLVGDVEQDAVLELLESRLSQWKGTRPPASAAAGATPPESNTVYLVDRPGAVQSVIMVGRLWRDRRDESYDAARIGDRVVGGDFLSRINQNLRERNGFTYGARSMFDFRRKGSTWTVVTSVQSQVTAAAVTEILRELSAAAGEQPLTEDEVFTALNAELSLMPQAFETPMSIAGALTQLALFDLPLDYFRARQLRLESIKPEPAAQLAAELTDPAQMVVLVVGDRAVVEPDLRAAGWQHVRYLDPDGRLIPASPTRHGRNGE